MALADWRDAIASYEQLGESDQVPRICAEMAYLMLWLNRMQEGYDIAGRGLTAVEGQVSHDRCRLLATGGLLSAGLGEPTRAAEMLDEAESIAQQLGEPELEGTVLSLRSFSCWATLDAQQGVDTGRRAAELLRQTDNLFWLADALTWTQMGLMCLGRLDDVARMADEVEAMTARMYGLFRNPWSCRAILSIANGDLRNQLNRSGSSHSNSCR